VCDFSGYWQNASVATGTWNGLAFAATANGYNNDFTVTFTTGAFSSWYLCSAATAAAAAAAAGGNHRW
jgi:hypothetical protein